MRGSVSLARLLRVSTVVIGLTIVSMGTSAPELAASLTAALQGRGTIAVGNVVGSNIFNIALIVGVCALVRPIVVHLSAIRVEWPVMVALSLVTLGMAVNGAIGRLEGAGLVITLVLFVAFLARGARTAPADEEVIAGAVEARTVPSRRRRIAIDLGLILAGLVLLTGGARLLVQGAVAIATVAGLSDRVIGLTIVAAGTSMPELATSIVAARRGQAEIALANVIGSNIFNLAGILGVVALVTPQVVPHEMLTTDLLWMTGYAVALFPLMRTGMRISRGEGALLLGTYAVYGVLLLR